MKTFSPSQTIKHKNCTDLVLLILDSLGDSKYQVLYLTTTGRILVTESETIKINNPENWSLYEVKNDFTKRTL